MCVDCVLASPKITQADPGRWTPPQGGSVTVSYQSKLEATHLYIKITTTLFSKDRLAHIRTIVVSWGGKLTVFTYCNYRIASTMVCCGFWKCSTYFVVDDLILLFVAFVELLGTMYASFLFMEIILLFMLMCRNLLVKNPLVGRFEKPIIWGY
jgi:hypothetical protein